MEWVASTLHTTSEHGVSSITTADPHTSAASSRLNWTPSPPANLNGLVRFAEWRNLVSEPVPSRFKRSLQTHGPEWNVFCAYKMNLYYNCFSILNFPRQSDWFLIQNLRVGEEDKTDSTVFCSN
jgi:hypothetical protein